MEIERKFLVAQLPDNLDNYNCRYIEQGYKGSGMIAREEYNLPLTKDSYEHLIKKADGNIITKKRYEIPDGNGYTIELDIFEGAFNGTVIAEVEFNTIEEADNYIMPEFFTEDVTNNPEYHNSNMSKKKFD